MTRGALDALRRVERELKNATDPDTTLAAVVRELDGLDRLSIELARADTIKCLRALGVPNPKRMFDGAMRSLG